MRRQQTRPHFGFSSLEGFLAAKMTVEGLRRAGPAPTRQRFVTALETMRNVDLGGDRSPEEIFRTITSRIPEGEASLVAIGLSLDGNSSSLRRS